MTTNSNDLPRVLHTAAWIWLAYLLALACMDWYLYNYNFAPITRLYYLVNGGIALLFLGFSYWTWPQKILNRLYVPLMLLLISALLIVANRLWIPRLPPGPLSNIEGQTLRLLPVLFIGLVITAWHYPFPVVALFAVGTSVFEIVVTMLISTQNPQADAFMANLILFVAVINSISLLVVGYFINRLINRLKNQQEQLAQANAQIRNYAGAVEELTISRERNRLARELHDTLAHSLSGLSVQLETALAYWDVEPETTRELLEKSLTATRSGLDDTRRALKALRASPIDDLGLRLALVKLAESAAERGNLRLSLSLPEPFPSLTPDVEQCIYRVAQEALENVVHHADAKSLALQLEISGEQVSLKIEDDGLGFDPQAAQTAGHYGLAGMRERAQVVGGQLLIDSQIGRGTWILLTIEGIRYDQSHYL
jgi:signal transduction histidine kinase